MIDVQLYIENNRIDLFDDETIELTSTIQDVRDIAKVFADYSKHLLFLLTKEITKYLSISTIRTLKVLMER